jgi:hypothetical protein
MESVENKRREGAKESKETQKNAKESASALRRATSVWTPASPG